MRHLALRSAALASAVTLLGAESVQASGFMVRENSAESVATVYAGNASRADDVSTVFNNPAGMAYLRGTQIEAGASVVAPDMHFTGEATVFGLAIPGVNDRSVGQFAMIPHLYAVTNITDRVKAGIAITVPFGNTVDYSENWPGRYVNIKTAAITIDINPNVSFRVTDHFAIAAGVSAQYLKLELSSAIPQFLIFGPGTPDGGYLLNANDWAVGWNIGMIGDLTDSTRVGLTYRSGIHHNIEGTLNFWATTSPFLGLATSPANAPLRLPASFTGSVTQQITPEFSLSSDIQFTQWDTFKKVSVYSPPNPVFTFDEEYRNSWMISVGGVYNLNPQWTVRSGVGFDQSPVTDGFRDTGVPDKSRVMIGLGGGYHFTPDTSIDVGYAHYFATGHASMNTSVNGIDPVTGVVVLQGSYNNSLDYLSVSFRTSL